MRSKKKRPAGIQAMSPGLYQQIRAAIRALAAQPGRA